MPHFSKENQGPEVRQARLPVGRRQRQVTGDLPKVPFCGEDNSSGRDTR